MAWISSVISVCSQARRPVQVDKKALAEERHAATTPPKRGTQSGQRTCRGLRSSGRLLVQGPRNPIRPGCRRYKAAQPAGRKRESETIWARKEKDMPAWISETEMSCHKPAQLLTCIMPQMSRGGCRVT